MLVSRYPAGEETVVVVDATRLDASVAHDFKSAVTEMIDNGHKTIVLDMHKVEFIDSSALGAIVGILKHMGKKGNFELAGLNRTVQKVFQLTRMTSVFTIRDRAPARG
ncbi:MAG: STAS domain-containing protein [Pseudomonadota bacterium]